MKKQPEVTAQTRKVLIDTYFEMTARGEKTTVGAITEAAGYNRCTFYRYFTDTEQLLSQVETEICNAFRAALTQNSVITASPEIIESLAAVYRSYGKYLSVLLGQHGDSRFARKVKEIIFPMASQMFAAANVSGVDAELKIEFALSGVLATDTKWYEMNQPIPEEQLGMLIRRMFQQGVLR